MSRLIVKNLPKTITEEKLRDLFATKGLITDLKLKYTKDGVFRGFAFVGYKSETDAQNAKNFFDNTYVGLAQIKVETCADIGSESKPRAWSKYAKDSSSYQKREEKQQQKLKVSVEESGGKSGKSKSKSKQVINELETFEKLKEDPKFVEFLEVNKRKDEKTSWANDAAVPQEDVADESKDVEFESSDSDSEEQKDEVEDATVKKSTKKQSDLEYLKSKIVKQNTTPADDGKGEKEKAPESADKSTGKEKDTSFTVVLRNLHCKCKKHDIKEFFQPLNPKKIRMTRFKGLAYAQFRSKKEVKQALIKHKSFLGGRSIEVTEYREKNEEQKKETEKIAKWEKNAKELENEESIAESGRLFVRNLSYTVTEDELEEHFKRYGPLTEVSVPIDKFSRRCKGFAHITFVIPEHAVKAFVEEDGKSFQGRMMHILPGKAASEKDKITDDMPFKKKKELLAKKLSSSDHNWNTLFLGTDAVARAMAERYNVDKSKILDPEASQSLAVRMALGETQLINETRDFLIEHGVQLDVFGQPITKRSKTTILVKNLPTKTPARALHELFSKHGELGRVLLPPHGIAAIVEFLEPSEAKAAFRNLAYTNFQHVPLYLEWAPVDMLSSPSSATEKAEEQSEEKEKRETTKGDDDSDVDEEDEEPESDTTVFVKNLNFDTTDEALHKHFSKCGVLHYATVSRKKNVGGSGESMLSMGFGFIQFKKRESAQKALKELQHSKLEDHRLELKLSHRIVNAPPKSARKKAKEVIQKTTKILIRNIPFEAKEREVRELFSTFGELKSVRLPKKADGSGSHRGFGFVDFFTRHDAKRAFRALCQSTHLFGRRLVLEWAATDDGNVDQLRKRTADHFHLGSQGVAKKKSKSNANLGEMMALSDQEDG